MPHFIYGSGLATKPVIETDGPELILDVIGLNGSLATEGGSSHYIATDSISATESSLLCHLSANAVNFTNSNATCGDSSAISSG